MRIAVLASLAVLFAILYLYAIGSNPAGIFCDEAQIGVEAWRLPRGEASLQPIPLFVRNFDYVHLGVMPMLVTAPFVALFGLDDFSIRLVAPVFMLATFAVLYCTLRRLRIPFAIVAVTLFALSPAVIHVGRINVGHPPSLLLLALGFDLFVRARLRDSTRLAVWAGICFGLSAYSNGPFYVFTPMVVGALALGEICFNGRGIRKWRVYAWTAGITALLLSPFVYKVLTDPVFLKRFDDKQMSQSALLSLDHLLTMAANYPKYYSLDFLFRLGEAGMHWNLRHSVPGAGELSWVVLPVVVLAIVALVYCWRYPAMRFLLPWVAIAIAYPLPDLITTYSGQPPYSFAVVGATLALPFLTGLALLAIEKLTVRRPLVLTVAASALLLATVVFGLRFYIGPYQAYPMISAGYWGWQYGPKPMIAYFKARAGSYDQFFMDGNYNGAIAFLDFYITEPALRQKADIGDVGRLDPAKRQLFAVRAEIWQDKYYPGWPARDLFQINEIIPYPNGEPAAYMVELKR